MNGSDGSSNFLNNLLPIIISTVVVMLTIAGGFWSLADTRPDLKDIRINYLTLREHEEFVTRFNKDIQRLESENQRQNDQFQTLLNARESKETSERNLAYMEKRLDDILSEVRELRKVSVEQRQLDGRIATIDKSITALQKTYDDLDDAFRAHVEKDGDRFLQQNGKRP